MPLIFGYLLLTSFRVIVKCKSVRPRFGVMGAGRTENMIDLDIFIRNMP